MAGIFFGRNHNYPDTVEGRIGHLEDRVRRVTWGFTTLVILLQLGSAVLSWVAREEDRDACLADAQRVAAISDSLKLAAVANIEDGNEETARVLNALVARLEALPEPDC